MDSNLAAMRMNYHTGAKRFLPMIFFLIVLVLIIPLYVVVFRTSKTKKNLFIALETERITLINTSTFTELTTFYPPDNNSFNGNFQLIANSPTSINFRVLNSKGDNITSRVDKASDKTGLSYVYFNNNLGGPVILQFTNSSNSNFITRLDIEY